MSRGVYWAFKSWLLRRRRVWSLHVVPCTPYGTREVYVVGGSHSITLILTLSITLTLTLTLTLYVYNLGPRKLHTSPLYISTPSSCRYREMM